VPNIKPAQHQHQLQSSRASGHLIPAKKNLHEREINLAITLVLISILFVFCQLFKLIPDIYELVQYYNFEKNYDFFFVLTRLIIDTYIKKFNQQVVHGRFFPMERFSLDFFTALFLPIFFGSYGKTNFKLPN
jgi:hypothetical protein